MEPTRGTSGGDGIGPAGPGPWLAAALVRAHLRRRSVVLCYHSVGSSSLDDDPAYLRVPPERFDQQLGILRAAGARFVTASTLLDELERALPGAPPRGLVAITFDDGYEDNLSVALPILERHGAPATVYVATGLVGAPSPWFATDAEVRMLAPEEVRELAVRGVEVGAHTVSHPDLRELDAGALRDELVDARTNLEALLGRPVRSFAYPFFAWDGRVRAAVEAAGYRSGLGGLHGTSLSDPFALPRVPVTGRHGILAYAVRLTGAYDRMFETAPSAALRAVTRSTRVAWRRRAARA